MKIVSLNTGFDEDTFKPTLEVGLILDIEAVYDNSSLDKLDFVV